MTTPRSKGCDYAWQSTITGRYTKRFCPGGALAVPRGDEVVEIANRMQKHFAIVVATQDWHPANHGSFASNHEGKKPGDVIDLHGIQQILWPVHCVQGTPGPSW